MSEILSINIREGDLFCLKDDFWYPQPDMSYRPFKAGKIALVTRVRSDKFLELLIDGEMVKWDVWSFQNSIDKHMSSSSNLVDRFSTKMRTLL